MNYYYLLHKRFGPEKFLLPIDLIIKMSESQIGGIIEIPVWREAGLARGSVFV